jgi:NAD(P)-dependent dehydrogenase (short-subunit alcohol dehydrogenase family)
MTTFPSPRSILITGGSSGIGEALALHYAKEGVTLFINGRDADRLDCVAEACRTKGAVVHPQVVHVTDRPAMEQWIADCDTLAPLNLVIANAGIAVGLGGVEGMRDAAHQCYDVNVNGVFNTVHPALDIMSRRKPYPVTNAQIGIVSSVMGYVGTARSPAYSSSKAAMKSYGQALRGAFRGMGIGVTVICPGYVRSRLMGPGMKGYPFMIEVDKAAAITAKALAKNKARITFPWQVLVIARIAINLPGFLADRLNQPWGVKRLEELER